jgi:hypothetical protein
LEKSIADAEKFLNKSAISPTELASLIKGLMSLKYFVAEEYLAVMYVKLVELMADEAKLNLENFRVPLEWIVEDEKRHKRNLKIIEKCWQTDGNKSTSHMRFPLFNFAINHSKNWIRFNNFSV